MSLSDAGSDPWIGCSGAGSCCSGTDIAWSGLSPCCVAPCCVKACCIAPCCVKACCVAPCCVAPCCVAPCCVAPCCVAPTSAVAEPTSAGPGAIAAAAAGGGGTSSDASGTKRGRLLSCRLLLFRASANSSTVSTTFRTISGLCDLACGGFRVASAPCKMETSQLKHSLPTLCI